MKRKRDGGQGERKSHFLRKEKRKKRKRKKKENEMAKFLLQPALRNERLELSKPTSEKKNNGMNGRAPPALHLIDEWPNCRCSL